MCIFSKPKGNVIFDIALMMQKNYYESEGKLSELASLCYGASEHIQDDKVRQEFEKEVARLSGVITVRINMIK